MTIAIGIIAFFVVLALLIFVHELGHFTFAKLMGVRVDEFGLGFPPRLKSWYRGGTRYSINAIPLGGFVRMLGENGQGTTPDSFGSKPPWQRFVILVAGPGMNLSLAVIVFFLSFLWGSPQFLTTITGVERGSPAATAGLRPNDTILAVDGSKVAYVDNLISATYPLAGKPVTLTVRRGSGTFNVVVVPRTNPPPHQGAIGIELNKSVIVRYGPVSALTMSFGQIGQYLQSLPLLFQDLSQHNAQGISGPVGIAQTTTQVIGAEPQFGPGFVLGWVALLSASLGVLNLLPIPALDGGRIVFVLLSWVRRRNLDPEVEGLIHVVGMAALLMLILFVSYQDLTRLVGGSS